MTREEKLDWLYRLRSEICVYMPKEWVEPMNNALDMAIIALQQKPILDKIIEDIQTLRGCSCWDSDGIIDDIEDIIDKYKVESESEK